MPNRLVPIPLPIRGLNTVNPFVGFDSGYAREFTNNSLYRGRVWTRPAIVSQQSHASVGLVEWFDVSGSTWHVIETDGSITKLSDNTSVGAGSIGGAPSYKATRCKHASLDLVIGLREPRLAATPFTAWSMDPYDATITETNIRAACSHKGRLYVCDEKDIHFSGLGQVAGAFTGGAFDASSFLGGQEILRMFSVTVNPSVTTENVFVIFGDGGKVLVYQGDYPTHSTWSLIANFDMPPPISNLGFVENDGDIWVSTTKYAYWFRDLFGGGAQTAYQNSPSTPIQNLWDGVKWSTSDDLYSHSFYEPYLDAIITQFEGPGSIINTDNWGDYASDAGYLVYFKKYQAWAFWVSAPFFAPVRIDIDKNDGDEFDIYAGTFFGEIVKLTHGETTDTYNNSGAGTQTIPIETSWKTPYLSTGNVIKLNGARIFFENTVNGYLEKIRSIFDFSDYNSPLGWYSQSTVTVDVPPGNYTDFQLNLTTVTWDQYQGFAEVGGVGGSVSLQITMKAKSGSSSTQDQSIYAATLHIEDGGEMF